MIPVALFAASLVAALEAGEPVYLPVDGSSVLPAVATKCPLCEGWGYYGDRGNPVTGQPRTIGPCPSCGGSGWDGDPLGVATKQWRRLTNSGVAATEWSSVLYKPVRPDPNVECRTAVVAYTWVTEHLPAVDADSADGEDTCVYLYGSGDVSILTTRPIKNTDITDRFTAPPSAGQVVLRCEGLVHLEQPITERPCKHGKFSPHYAEPCDDSGRVPLVVPPATITEVPDA